MAATITDRILRRIRGKGRGWTFVPKDLLDLGSRAAVDQALSRLARKDRIRRVGRGIYDYPRVSKRLGVLSPSVDAIASAVARKSNSQLQVSDAQAANALGLTTQISAKPIYFTSGPSKVVRAGNHYIIFKHTKSLSDKNTIKSKWAQFARQALNFVGPDGLDDNMAHKILLFTNAHKSTDVLFKNIPSWAHKILWDNRTDKVRAQSTVR
jgi:hypothetical protein